MGFKDILVHVDRGKPCETRLEVAVTLAAEHQAHLAGLFFTEHPPYLSQRRQEAPGEVREARRRFEELGARGGIENEWLHVEQTASGLGLIEAINIHAHYRDLLILGQNDPEAGNPTLTELAERAVLGAGRPVLIVPYAGRFETVGRRILLAWRGGPESSRAVHDALPLLRRARQVQIVSVKTGEDEPGPVSGDLPAYLGRHGIAAQFETVDPVGLGVGDMLLNRAADHGSDLLVMGAFAQTRRGLPGLGEVGRHLLRCMTIPVLMSH